MNEKLKKQFDEMKAKTDGALLIFSVGDFYETYEEDAEATAEILGITLTKKGDTKMAGFPRHSLDTYLPKLIRAGKRVAMCDQYKEAKVAKKEVAKLPQPLGEVKKIKTSLIHPSAMNPRKTFDEEAICELADSIKQHGLLQPITIRLKGRSYEIVMGERRYRAWLENMRINPDFPNEIPCIIREMTDEEALDAMITENLQRKDVDPIEEAFAFGQLHANGKSIEEIALRFGKSARFIRDRIKLDSLLTELKQWVTKGYMNIGAAMHISKLTQIEQQGFVDEFVQDDMTEYEDDPINKENAEDYTDNLFMRIDSAPWHHKFEGTCKTTCEKCPFNNANVGCLFYEMKPHNACCTNRVKWNTKKASWLLQILKDNEDVLVKEGEELEKGKTVIAIEAQSPYYQERGKNEYERLIKSIKELGFKMVNKDDLFERWSSYRESDERLKEKLEKNEVYRCIVPGIDYRGTSIEVKYFEWKKHTTGEDASQADAMKLVQEYQENIRRSAENKAHKLREILNEMNPEELNKKLLSPNETLIFFTLILRRCSHKFREQCGVTGYKSTKSPMDYVRKNIDQRQLIKRDFMREVLGSSEVTWSTDLQQCQSLLLQEWAKDKVEEIEAEYAAKLAKKQEKIKDKLIALGYDTNGKKLAF